MKRFLRSQAIRAPASAKRTVIDESAAKIDSGGMKKRFALLALLLMISMPHLANAADSDDRIFQYSTIEALLSGVYDGTMTYGHLRDKGDFGIGTFQHLDGEMIGVDGEFYQIKSDGKAYAVDDDAMTPFATMKFFRTDITLHPPKGLTFSQLSDFIDKQLPSPNLIYAVRINGTFKQVKTRSVPAQEKPYKPATEVVKKQPTFDFKDMTGIMAGYRFPSYLRMVSVPGYHLHFLTAKHDAGGHVLDMVTNEVTVRIDTASGLELALPGEGDFLTKPLGKDNTAAMKAVEHKQR